METTPGKRIQQWREFKGLTLAQMSRDSGVKVTTLSTAEQPGASNPSFDTFSKLLTAYPDLNPDWLLTGNGPMLRDGKELTPVKPAAPMQVVSEDAEVIRLKEANRQKDEMINLLKQQLAWTQSLVAAGDGGLGKLLDGNYAAGAPAASIGFDYAKAAKGNVTMLGDLLPMTAGNRLFYRCPLTGNVVGLTVAQMRPVTAQASEMKAA